MKETFEAAVHNNGSFSNNEKLLYLKTYLDKSALQAVEGFPLSIQNRVADSQIDLNIMQKKIFIA